MEFYVQVNVVKSEDVKESADLSNLKLSVTAKAPSCDANGKDKSETASVTLVRAVRKNPWFLMIGFFAAIVLFIGLYFGWVC